MSIHPMRAMLDAEVVQLSALVTAIKGQQGSAAKRLESATLTALGQDVTINSVDLVTFDFPVETEWQADDPNEDGTPATDDDGNPLGTEVARFNIGTLAGFVADLNSWAEQVANEAVSVILAADKNADQLEALREQYKTKKELCDALMVVLKSEKVDVSDVEIPALRGSHGPRATGAKSSHGRWYRIVKGVRKEQSDSQNNISSFAFYHGADMLKCIGQYPNNKGKGVPKDVLEKWLRETVTDSPLGKSWSVEVDGITYGLDVKSDNKGTDEEE